MIAGVVEGVAAATLIVAGGEALDRAVVAPSALLGGADDLLGRGPVEPAGERDLEHSSARGRKRERPGALGHGQRDPVSVLARGGNGQCATVAGVVQPRDIAGDRLDA